MSRVLPLLLRLKGFFLDVPHLAVFAGRDHSLSHCRSQHSETLAEANPNAPQRTYFYANSSSCSPGLFEPGSRPTSLVQPDTLLCRHREPFLCWLLGTSVRKASRFLRTDVPSSQHNGAKRRKQAG